MDSVFVSEPDGFASDLDSAGFQHKWVSSTARISVLTVLSVLSGYWLDAQQPTKEYIRLGDRVIAIVNPASIPSFSITAPSGTVTLAAGSSGQYTVSTAAQNGFNSAVSFSLSGLPTGASASFNRRR